MKINGKRWTVSLVLGWAMFQLHAQQTTTIAFGSCIHQDNPQEIWKKVDELHPDYFVFLGDNIYGDTKDMGVLRAKYEKLFSKPGLKQMISHGTQVKGVWDDHDYGKNDGGKEYPMKAASKELFLEYFKEPQESDRRKHEGIYHSEIIGTPGNRVQFIFLDTRTFRDKLCLARIANDCKGEYRPCISKRKSMLGEAQWAWLEQTLLQPAEVRVVCSSTQFLVDFNGWEAWANLPHERERFLKLIEKTHASGLFFISGDVHYSELSKLDRSNAYPIYDLTSSGMTHGHSCAGANVNRVGEPFMKPNFGWIEIAWNGADTKIMLQIKDEQLGTPIKTDLYIKDLRNKNW